MAEVGPDGALWVLDWYNYIIQHNPTPHGFKNGKGNAYETPLRDKRHGRIYRVAWDKARKATPMDLSKASPSALVQALRNDNQLWRMHAQRLLVERGDASVIPALLRLSRDASVDPVGLNVGAQHALWTLAGLGANTRPDAVKAVQDSLRHRSAAVRRAAIAALPRDGTGAAAMGAQRMIEDVDAQVRLAALLAYSEMPVSDPVGRLVFGMLREERNGTDRWIPHAATSAGARHHRGFLRAAIEKPRAGQSVVLAEGARAAVRIVAQHQAATAPMEALETTLALADAAPVVAAAVLDGFVAGWNASSPPSLSEEQRKALVTMANRLDDASRGSLIALGDRWGQKAVFAGLVEATAKALKGQLTEALTDAERTALARRLMSLDDRRESVRAIMGIVTPQTPPSLVSGLIAAIGTSREPGTAEELLAAFPSLTPAARRTVVGTLTRRAEWAAALLSAVESGRLDRTDLAWDHWDQLRGHPDKAVATKAAQVEGKKATRTNADMETMVARLMPLANRAGDVERGRKAFETTCMVCHAFNGRGQHVGPDLTGMGARPKGELLVEIVDPNRSVEANYRMWTVVRRDGESVSGRLDGETATGVDILDTTGQKHSIQRKDIARIEASQQSIMPTGFDQLPAEDLAGILEYIATAGRAK
jgi:putative heme-binding domain-containing protein